jgi:hypothetical protein
VTQTRQCGTYSSYRLGCRCEDCRRAASDRRRTWNSYDKQPIEPAGCGTAASYARGCRCDACVQARHDAALQWPSSRKSRGIVAARQVVDPVNVEAFADGLLDHTQTTPAERKAAARLMDARGVSRNDIARRTRLNYSTLWREFRKDEPVTGYRYESPNGVAIWAKLHVPHPGVDDVECKSRHDLFADWLEGNTRHLMRHGAPDVWAQRYIGEALAVCARCPVREWCVTATKPQQSRVSIIAGGSVWHDGVEVWTLAQQEALAAAQDADREDAVA